MTWINNRCLFGVLVIGLAVLQACSEVQYVDHQRSVPLSQIPDEPSAFSRRVDYHLGRAFYETPPACVMVLPITLESVDRQSAAIIEDAVSRHVAIRFDKTITARHVTFISRKRAFDPAHKGDIKRLGQSLRCDAQLEINAVSIDNFYAVIWTDLSVLILLTLTRVKDGVVLWRGRHTSNRAGGGLPITLVGAGVGTFSAGKLASDPDVLPSMIDDVVRRVMASLPDTRRF